MEEDPIKALLRDAENMQKKGRKYVSTEELISRCKSLGMAKGEIMQLLALYTIFVEEEGEED